MTKQVKRRNGITATVLRVKFPSGGNLSWTVNSAGERLRVVLTEDKTERKEQRNLIKNWLSPREGEMNFQRFNRLENLIREATDERDLMKRVSLQLPLEADSETLKKLREN